MSTQLRFSATITTLTMALFALIAAGGGFADGPVTGSHTTSPLIATQALR